MQSYNFKSLTMVVGTALTVVSTSASAYEFGASPWSRPPGVVIVEPAALPPPGLYGFVQPGYYSASVQGPGTNNANFKASSVLAGLIWSPGWNFLGADYSAMIMQPFAAASFGSPVNVQPSGLANTLLFPVELSWRFGDSGWFFKTYLGAAVPSGSIEPGNAFVGGVPLGPNGLGSIGTPWWTVMPGGTLSYLRDGWNFTANIYAELNTHNTYTGYTSGDVLHAEFQATKKFGKWKLGPVGYYVGQVSDDKSSSFYNGAINTNRYDVWAAGGLIGYDFGPVQLDVYALNQIHASASGGTPFFPGQRDSATILKGWQVFSTLSFRLWGDDPPHGSGGPIFKK